MPRYNNEGRSSKFVHMIGASGGGKKFDQDDKSRFKFTINRGGIQRKNRGSAFARLDATGDTVMDPAEPSSSRGGHNVHFDGNVRHGKKHSNKQWRKQNQNQQGRSRDAHLFGPTWHKISIVNGKAYTREFVLAALGENCRVPFIPICYATYGVNTAFYVENRPMAEALAECSGQIMSSDGQNKIILRVTATGTPPTAHIDDECELRIKQVLDTRFNGVLKTLNLENFSMSPELVTDYFLPLYRPSVVQKLADLLQPHLDSIVGLDLSNNKLPALEGLSKIINKSTSLKALNLRGNKIRDLQSLDRISAPSILELILEGNPLCDNTRDKEAYISSVRKRFPKVIKLDGNDLPAPLSFDVSEPTKMPEIHGSSFCNEQAKSVVIRFWELYVSIFDSDDRQPLLEAYHDTASMSMMASYSQSGHVSQIETSKKLSYYLQDSRNLIRQTDKTKRFKLLHQGKLDIVSFLSKFPKTTHDPNSYLIDMPVAVENFILFNVTGIFKERDERSTPYRYYCRTITLVPQNSGFVIINEMVYITNPTVEQVKVAFRQPAPTPSPSPVPHVQVPVPEPVQYSDEQRLQILALFSAQSGMNDEWSRKCLEENAWDFNKSALVFTQLKEHGKIPPEAFVK